MKILEFNQCNDGFNEKQLEKIRTFLSKNYELKINCKFEAVDNVRYWQHKYVHGYLLPDIIDCWGEPDAKFITKKMYLLKDIYCLTDIPSHHRKKCNVIIDIENNPFAYIPSLSVLTFDEMNKYILCLEILLKEEIGGCINPKHQKEALYAKSQIIKEQKGDKLEQRKKRIDNEEG